MAKNVKLTEMISVSLTPAQLEALERASRNSGVGKVGTYARSILVQHLKELNLIPTELAEETEEDE